LDLCDNVGGLNTPTPDGSLSHLTTAGEGTESEQRGEERWEDKGEMLGSDVEEVEEEGVDGEEGVRGDR